MIDREPPHNTDSERSVIASAMLSNDAVDDTNGLRPDQFYYDHHRTTWTTILDLHAKGKPVDAVSVAERLDKDNRLEDVGGVAFLTEVLQAVPHAAHAGYYADIVRDKWVLRETIYRCGEVIRQTYDGVFDGGDAVDMASSKIGELADMVIRPETEPLGGVLSDWMREMESGGADPGPPTGFVDLDKLVVGFRPGNLIVLAARPSVGKSAFGANIAANVAEQGIGVVLFSLEMAQMEIAERLLVSKSQVNSHNIRSNTLTESDRHYVVDAANALDQLPIYIDDSPNRTSRDIASITRSMVRKHGIGMVIVDYLQLIQPEDKRMVREQQVATMTRGLKALAKSENIPVVVLAQLNRDVEKRVGKARRPRKSDLRESGAIEQDADVLLFLDRPNTYDIDRPEAETHLWLDKHRNGPTGKVYLSWNGSIMTFRNARNGEFDSF